MKFLILLIALFSMPAFAAQKLTNKGISYLPVFGYGSTTSVAYTGTQGSLGVPANVGEQTMLVRVYTTSAAYLAIGDAPVASSAGVPIAANTETVIEVLAGKYIAALQQSSGGTMYVTRLPIYKDKD